MYPSNVRYLDITETSLGDLRDSELLRRSISNPSLFGLLVDRYQEPLLRKARRILQSEEDAIDAVQDTFTKIYRNAGKFEDVAGASFSSWAYMILTNTCFSYYAKEKRKRSHETKMDSDEYEELPDTGYQASEALESADYLSSVFSKMPTNLRRILELYFVEGKPQQEIAKLEGVSVAAVKRRMHRAKQLFKKISLAITHYGN